MRLRFALSLLAVLMTSCAAKRTATLFADPGHEQYFNARKTRNYSVIKYNYQDSTTVHYAYRIRVNDEISVRILNLPIELSTSNIAVRPRGADESYLNYTGLIEETAYKVDVDGYIHTNLIGSVPIQGKTIREVREMLEKLYSNVFKEPKIDVRVTTLRVFAFGEFGNAGPVLLPREQTHLVEVIALAGGIKQEGRVNKLKIIRGSFQDPEIIWVNMRNVEALNDSSLYLHDGDILFVEKRSLPYFLSESRPYVALLNTLLVIPTLYLLGRNLANSP